MGGRLGGLLRLGISGDGLDVLNRKRDARLFLVEHHVS